MGKEFKNNLQLDPPEHREEVSRRSFLAGTGGAALAVAASGLLDSRAFAQASSTPPAPQSTDESPIPASKEKTVEKGVWVVKESGALRSLTIAEGASLAAPAGKSLTMTVEGVGTPIKPGTYKGDIFLTVAEKLTMLPVGLMANGKPKEYRAAVFVKDGKYVQEKSVPAIARNGKVSDSAAVGVSIMSCEDSFNGIIVTGDSEYTVEGAKIYFEGMSHNDFAGEGPGIYCGGNAKVTVNNSSLRFSGVTRAAVMVCGNGVATFNNCRISNDSPATDYMSPTWTCGFKGSNRVTLHCDNATSYYNNCHLSGNGWGVLGHDGGSVVRMYVNDSTIELSGPRSRGYGAYSIGDDSLVSFDHCIVNVQGYPMALSGVYSKACGEIKGGTVINSTLYGAMMFNVLRSELKISKSTLNTASSTLVVKGTTSASISIDDAAIKPGNGVILQLMDSDLPDEMNYSEFIVPVGLADTTIPGRDLTVAAPKADILMTVANTEVAGDFYNSTTNLKANCNKKAKKIVQGRIPGFPKEVLDAMGALPAPPAGSGNKSVSYDDLQVPKNLELKFVNTTVKGVISAATAAYKEGVTTIDPTNCLELSAVTQTAHEAVNNGVIVFFDNDSAWVVTGTSYLTSLTIDDGATVIAPNGKTLTMTVDGAKTKIAPGTYKGKIVLTVV
jgi:hypothetical protein